MNASYFEPCRRIVEGTSLEDKLADLSQLEFGESKDYVIPDKPGRDPRFDFSEKRGKFPKNFEAEESRGKALHFFANHELLAIEMMAAALLYFPHQTEDQIKFKKGIIQTLKEEQKHFKLYQHRMKNFGLEFGDLPVNAFFWRQMQSLKTPEAYLAMMSLTFEMANLDFMLYYQNAFRAVEDYQTADILQIVLDDEISHVAFGVHHLNRFKKDLDLWDYYCSLLPMPITPARSKGMVINHQARLEAGIDESFLQKAIQFQDDYRLTQRKSWKEL